MPGLGLRSSALFAEVGESVVILSESSFTSPAGMQMKWSWEREKWRTIQEVVRGFHVEKVSVMWGGQDELVLLRPASASSQNAKKLETKKKEEEMDIIEFDRFHHHTPREIEKEIEEVWGKRNKKAGENLFLETIPNLNPSWIWILRRDPENTSPLHWLTQISITQDARTESRFESILCKYNDFLDLNSKIHPNIGNLEIA